MSSHRLVLINHLQSFLNGNYTVGSPLGFADENPITILTQFLKRPTEAQYPVAANILQAFVNKCQTVVSAPTDVYRVIATFPGGTVWFDSSKGTKNTWANYLTNSINSDNYNTRRPVMQVLMNDDQYAYETKWASTTADEFRVSMRVGDSIIEPIGVISLSIVTNI